MIQKISRHIPDCIFTKVQGFTDDEVSMLTDYLRANLTELKKRAAGINPLTAIMGRSVQDRYLNKNGMDLYPWRFKEQKKP